MPASSKTAGRRIRYAGLICLLAPASTIAHVTVTVKFTERGPGIVPVCGTSGPWVAAGSPAGGEYAWSATLGEPSPTTGDSSTFMAGSSGGVGRIQVTYTYEDDQATVHATIIVLEVIAIDPDPLVFAVGEQASAKAITVPPGRENSDLITMSAQGVTVVSTDAGHITVTSDTPATGTITARCGCSEATGQVKAVGVTGLDVSGAVPSLIEPDTYVDCWEDDANAFVEITAQLDPPCSDEEAEDLIHWGEGGVPHPTDPRKRLVSKNVAARTTVTATVGTSSVSVDVLVIKVNWIKVADQNQPALSRTNPPDANDLYIPEADPFGRGYVNLWWSYSPPGAGDYIVCKVDGDVAFPNGCVLDDLPQPMPIILAPTDGNRSYTIRVGVDRDGSRELDEGDCGEVQITVHVVRLDLDIDSNNDGQINDADDPNEEDLPGCLVALNSDDDNHNGVPDCSDPNDTSPGLDEDDLATIELTFLPPSAEGEVTLAAWAGGQCVRIWSTPHKNAGTEVALPRTWEVSGMPSSLYVEGVAPGSVKLQLVFTNRGNGVARDKVSLTVIKIDLDVDADRNGVVTDTESDDLLEDTWTFGDPTADPNIRGAVILCNNDNDDGPGDPNVDNENSVIDGADDVDDLARLVIRATGIESFPPHWAASLFVADNEKIRIFNALDPNTASAVIGPSDALYDINDYGPADLTFGMEALRYPNDPCDQDDAFIDICLDVWKDPNGPVWFRDRVTVRIAPWVMPWAGRQAQRLFVVHTGDNDRFVTDVSNAAAAAGVPVTTIPGAPYVNDRWIQDQIELGYSQLPARSRVHVVFDSPRNDGLDPYPEAVLLNDPNFGYGWFTCPPDAGESLDSFGNLEATPPTSYQGTKRLLRLGRMIYGGGAPRRMSWTIRDILHAQLVQEPAEIDTGWLSVGHVDEILSAITSTRLLIADPNTAVQILTDLQNAGKGGLWLFQGKKWPPRHALTAYYGTVDADRTVSDVLADPNVMAYNAHVQNRIEGVRAALTAEFGIDPNTFCIKVPVLFYPTDPNYFSHAPDPGNEPTQALAYTPDMVNLTVLNGHLLIPEPFGPNDAGTDVFEQYMHDALSGLGVTPNFIDDWQECHVLHGGIHCATNVLREPWDTPWWVYEDPAGCGSAASEMLFLLALPVLSVARLRRG